MNKRKYPHGIDMCPQLKIHISDMEIANGVMGSSKMLEIYGKDIFFLHIIIYIKYFIKIGNLIFLLF